MEVVLDDVDAKPQFDAVSPHLLHFSPIFHSYLFFFSCILYLRDLDTILVSKLSTPCQCQRKLPLPPLLYNGQSEDRKTGTIPKVLNWIYFSVSKPHFLSSLSLTQ